PGGLAQPAARQRRLPAADAGNAGGLAARQRLRAGAQSRRAARAGAASLVLKEDTMKTRRIERGEKVAPGLVLTRDLGSLKKGRVLSEADVRAIDAAVWKDLDVLELEPGDVHEDAAGRRLATALAGEGVGVGDVDGGSFPLELSFFGSRLETARAVPGNPQALAQAIRDEQRAGARLLVLAGSRSMDPQDPVLQALELAGARMERHGVPAYPGTLLWVAYLGDVALLGAPSCGIFTRATSLDFVLPRLMAGDRMDAAAIAQLS